MAYKNGRCTNFGGCTIADSRKVLRIATTDDFKCPECGSSLYAANPSPADTSSGGGGSKIGPILGIVGLLALLGGGGYYLYNMLSKPKAGGGETASKNIIIAKRDTIIEHKGAKFNLAKNDTFKLIDGKATISRFRMAASDCSRKNVMADVKNKGVLRVGMENDAAPMMFEQNGGYKGFDWEMLQTVAKKTFGNSTRIEPVFGEYDDLPSMLTSGKVDLIAGGFTPHVVSGVDWTEGYMDFGYCLIVKKGQASAIRGLSDLKNLRIGIYEDDAAERWVKENVKGYKSIERGQDDPNNPNYSWLSMLQANKVDAIIYDFPFAAAEVADFKDLAMSNNNLNRETPSKKAFSYAIGLPCGNEFLFGKLNDELINFKNSSDYDRLVNTYIKTSAVTIVKPTDAATNSKEYYQVKAGETLSLIAQRELGNINRWQDIYNLNPHLASPNLIFVGDLLKLPAK
jgi:ABC-type amino acid transport substrate-binding protein